MSELAPTATADDSATAAVRPTSEARPLLTVPLLTRLELAVAAAVTLLVLYLHIFFCQNVGALWRDEVNSINVATLPTFGELWNTLEFDSFPVLYFGVLRAWAAVFGAGDDTSLRVLGLLIGLGIVGALWLNARQFGVRWPLFSLVLLGCNPLFVRYGDSNRAYGLGMLLILLTLAAVWRVLIEPRPARVALAVVAAILSVQTLYYNSVLLFSICVAGAVAALCERRWRTAVCILAIGAPAALSLVVYADTIHRLHDWNFLMQYPVTLPWLWHKLSEVTGSPNPLGVWVWSALFVGALGLAVRRLWRSEPDTQPADPARRAIIFAATALVAMSICYPVFLKALNYFTQPWYYVAFLALAAICLDVVFGHVLAGINPAALYGRAAQLAGVLALVLLTFLSARTALTARQTNVDLHAQQLEAQAAEGDLIVCTRWECAITLARYYHGKAALVTLPPIGDHRSHRYDLIKKQMMTPDAAGPVLARMEATLRAGHRVWLSGPPTVPPDGRAPVAPPAARVVDGRFIAGGDYYGGWADQAGWLLQEHATGFARIPVASGQPVIWYERLPLAVFEGWH